MTSLERGLEIICEFGLNSDVRSRALDLCSETGELCKEVLKSTNYGSSNFEPSPNLEMELGDTMFSLLVFASSLNLDLDAALEKSTQKMRARVEETGSPSSITT
jgi:NTP pyrophosphatase (non-canonical NTP hydrolase)